MHVYLDGQFIDEAEARLGAFDAAVQHGVGLFETMRAYGGVVFRLREHVDRLIASAKELGLTEQMRPEPLCEAVDKTVQKNGLTEARIRLTVTGGDLSMLAAAKGATGGKRHQPGVLIQCSEPTQYPERMFTEGVTASIADPKANPFDPLAGHKSIQYWQRLRSLVAAGSSGAAEALWFSVTNHLCGGAVSNALLVKDEQILTPLARGEESGEGPAMPAPVLPGITRAAALAEAEAIDVPVQRQMLTINDVLEADELMLTNTSWLVLPVVRLEKEKIGGGEVGPVTRRLYERLTERIHAECIGPADDTAAPSG